ncbi:hypothetical protein ASC59_07540 [Leifsonia sp. Root1293]|nr:hypothetical protein ASC59_07540 [Leifsonia sp. Root1293]KRA11868.1 hypothetical protein ASD61_07540 [Leifsonia sp. Root60]
MPGSRGYPEQVEYVIEFDTKPQLVGTFHSQAEAEVAAERIAEHRGVSSWRVRQVYNGAMALAELR